MIYDDYQEILFKYRNTYGDMTLVLMECGSFYELYDDGTKMTNLREIGSLLGIQVSRRNKSIIEVSRSNLEMAGFPSYALNKFLNILTKNNYTVVVVSQTTPPPNPKREVTHIASPGTYIEDESYMNKYESNYLMCIYLEKHIDFRTKQPTIAIGCSLIDIGTGKTYCLELVSRINDLQYPLDELYRISSSFCPREIIICSLIDNDIITFEQIIKHLDIEDKCLHNYTKNFDNSLTKMSYQEEILKRVFHHQSLGLLSCIEFLGLDMKPCALTSYVKLIQFVHEHNERCLVNIKQPCILEESNSLILSYNSIKQLDIVPPEQYTKSKSLLDILNNCKTAVGRRYFKERLVTPMKNAVEIENSYQNIEALLSDKQFIQIREILANIYDIERLFKRVDFNSIHPNELYNLYVSSTLLHQITLIYPNNHYNITHIISLIKDYFSTAFNIDELPKYNLDNISAAIFNKGFDKEIDELYNDYNETKNFFETFVDKLNNIAKDIFFKLESNDRDGLYILTTNKRWQEFIKCNNNTTIVIDTKKIVVNTLTFKNVSHSSSNIKITHTYFQSLNEHIDSIDMKLKKKVLEIYKISLKTFSSSISPYVIHLCKTLAEVDYYSCCAYNAFNNRYNKPTINNKYENKSYLQIQQLRHPIIEKLLTDIQYITNDISLGIPEEEDGILLYGLNSSGKSSLMKSIGIAIVMAQAGMYVACENMEFYPYDYIFTRILSCDDIYKGQSTFTKEIMELRGILKRSNRNSLILGDELCSGTESISALSIVSAGIYTLSQRKSSFMFATHLHDLVNISEVNSLTNVKTYHLSVEYDTKSKKLIYNRQLQEGNGSTLYGLEVCRSLDMDKEFLELANSVRHQLLNTHSNILPSTSNNNKYNKKVYLDRCQICNNKAQEIHHIQQQKDADENGFIGSYHKNSKFNLVCLCEKCHDQVHNGTLEIYGYRQTSDGIELDFVLKEPEKRFNSIKDDIKELLNQNPPPKKKDVITFLMQKHNVSKYKIEKEIKASC